MQIIKEITILSLLLFGVSASCQNKNKTNLYLDANLNKISEEEFLEKKQSWIFYAQEVVIDGHVYQMLDYYFEMGQLDSLYNQELRKDFTDFYKIPKTKNQTLFIHYRKNLMGYAKTRESWGPVKVVMPYSYDTIQYKMTKAHYLKRKTSYDESAKKCHKFNSKHNIVHLHLYEIDQGYVFDNSNFKWHQIMEPTRAKFFNFDDWSFLIIKPNGDYVKFLEFPHHKIEKLLRKKDWATIKKTYNTALENLENERKGFFYNKWRYPNGKSFEVNKQLNKNEFRRRYEQYRINSTETDCFYLGY